MFVLLSIILLAGISVALAIAASLLLLLTAHLVVPKGAAGRRRALFISAGFPFITLVYFAGAFVAYCFVSESVGRPVDSGDCWVLALDDGYRMVMIDTPERASISLAGTADIVSDITNIAHVAPIVVGETTDRDAPRFFLLNTVTRRYVTFTDEASLRKAAKRAGVSAFTLQTPEDFYYQHRVGPFEWWSLILALIFPVGGLCWLIRYLVVVRRRAWEAVPLSIRDSHP